jgi:hypothetical protein
MCKAGISQKGLSSLNLGKKSLGKTSMVVEHQEVIKETFYKDLIENNDEYSILPKALLRDYKMVPEKILERINQNNDELKAALVEKYERYIAILEKENEALKAQLQKR